jgi:hypothetical protein
MGILSPQTKHTASQPLFLVTQDLNFIVTQDLNFIVEFLTQAVLQVFNKD